MVDHFPLLSGKSDLEEVGEDIDLLACRAEGGTRVVVCKHETLLTDFCLGAGVIVFGGAREFRLVVAARESHGGEEMEERRHDLGDFVHSKLYTAISS